MRGINIAPFVLIYYRKFYKINRSFCVLIFLIKISIILVLSLEPKGEILHINGKTDDDVVLSLDKALQIMRITARENKVLDKLHVLGIGPLYQGLLYY